MSKGSEVPEKGFRRGPCIGRWRVEPGECIGRLDAQSSKNQGYFREIGSLDLGKIMVGTSHPIGFGKQANALSMPRSSGATCPLDCGCLANGQGI